ncbi:hypothetical protein Tsubulata_024549 [Turnera subulata]|uniref:Uncharacterized protein n=1 Tax=Turnera subulata TaxID=218843 RepID=A0A9Q0JIE4_9ROSI|nr:hypothetical protein Tsubulata_024549 [Turnera subulata]
MGVQKIHHPRDADHTISINKFNLMASTLSPTLLHHTLSLHRARTAHPTSCKAHAPNPAPPPPLPNRRQLLFLLSSAPALVATERSALAEDIGLFGLRRKLKTAEQEAEELVREGFEAAEKGLESAEKGIVTAEKGIVTVEKGIETAEREIEGAVSFGGLAQAGAVAGAEGTTA